MPTSDTIKEARLLGYMVGFRRGVSGGACTPTQMADKHFRAGHTAGRNAIHAAYQGACEHYEAELTPLKLKTDRGTKFEVLAALESDPDYTAYLQWYSEEQKRVVAGTSRYEFPLTIEKYNRSKRSRSKKP